LCRAQQLLGNFQAAQHTLRAASQVNFSPLT
jgi:hypothetical protein